MHPGERELLAQLERELDLEWREERAAILEFEAGLTRAAAERQVRTLRCPFRPMDEARARAPR